ncbi:MAG: glutamate--tRNA ligase, partial [Betaproteobacteria bacterium]
SADQMVQWFDGSHLAKSPAQWDPAKLAWVNAHYIKQADDQRLAALVQQQLHSRGVGVALDAKLVAQCALFKERCNTTVELTDWIEVYHRAPAPAAAERAQHVTEAVVPALRGLRERLTACEWTKEGVAAALKQTLAEHGLKMPALAMPLRLLVCGRLQTPSVDAVLALFTREEALRRLRGV